ncbi:hypothetical protein BB558_000131 [Smittium angustum]|uniref:CAP-Gly domain-containing protein n=1 Tax=Smittium angustum TaxID=133377 RepID=A0A2U1JFC5_SMIAN|nr:hypothetical protein BB558_003254 [Smittium angustum]PWA03704.1 hypothetical protein BB558_000131 [Smittium angustum]
MKYYINQRIKVDEKGRGTIKYIGEIQGVSGTWLGVEWDNPSSGKHSGEHNDLQYFSVRIPNSGSFIKPSKKVHTGTSLFEAIKEKYIERNLTYSEKELPENIGKYGKIEAVGFGKITAEKSNLELLQMVGLENGSVYGIEQDEIHKLSKSLIRLEELDLRENLIAAWTDALQIIKSIPTLKSINFGNNKMQFYNSPDFNNLSLQKYSEIEILDMSSTGVSWKQVVDICTNNFPNLKSLILARNDLKLVDVDKETVASAFKNLEELNLQANNIQSSEEISFLGRIQNLKVLNVSENPLDEFLVKGFDKISDEFQSLRVLQINDTEINNWMVISQFEHLQLEELGIRRTKITWPNSVEKIRAHAISRVPSLKKINGVFIDSMARRDLERLYLSDTRKLYLSLFSVSNPKIFEFLENHPRFSVLCNILNEPGLSENPGQIANKQINLKSRLLNINIQIADILETESETGEPNQLVNLIPVIGTIKNKAVPTTTMIRQFKSIVSRLYKIQPTKIEIWRCIEYTNGSKGYINLDAQTRDFEFYDIEDNDTIYVVKV